MSASSRPGRAPRRERVPWRRRVLFRAYYSVYRADRFFKVRFTALGKVLVGTFVLAAVFGVNTRAAMSYQLAMLSAALLLVGAASALTFRVRMKARRTLPRYCR